MIKQNVKLSKEQKSLRAALGKFAPLFNHLRKIEADLREAGKPALADLTVKEFYNIKGLEDAIMAAHKLAETDWSLRPDTRDLAGPRHFT